MALKNRKKILQSCKTRGGVSEDSSKESAKDSSKENKPKFFLTNAGVVICRQTVTLPEKDEKGATQTEVITTVVQGPTKDKGKKPASGTNVTKKSKSDTASRSRSSSLQRSTSQLSAVDPRDRRRSKIDIHSPSAV